MSLAWTIITALRLKADTGKYSYFSLGGACNFDNFVQLWSRGGFTKCAMNSVLITVPSVIPVLSFCVHNGLCLSPRKLAGQRHPADHGYGRKPAAAPGPGGRAGCDVQLLELLYSISDSGSLLKTYLSVIAVSTTFRIGFVTFLLSSYSATQGGRKYCRPDVRNPDQPDPAVGLCPVFLG